MCEVSLTKLVAEILEAVQELRNRRFSFFVPFFFDSAIAFVQTAVPLLAIRFGATEALLGWIGAIGSGVRTPTCLTSGRLSERVGRKRVIIPASFVFAAGCLLAVLSSSLVWVIAGYAMAMVAAGLFYPPLIALIGDISTRKELRKNLGSFNIGWCVGGAAAAVSAGLILKLGISALFYIAGAGTLVSALLVSVWRDGHRHSAAVADDSTAHMVHSRALLLIGRMGMGLGFFTFQIVRMLFPKLGKSEFLWSEPMIALVVSMMLVGEAVGILGTSAHPWWRGKLWPQIAAQGAILSGGLAAVFSASPVVLGAAFFLIGAAITVPYTTALYYGISINLRGKNAGIHEGIVAGSGVTGCLLGGYVGSALTPRAPYALVGCVAFLCLVVSLMVWKRLADRDVLK